MSSGCCRWGGGWPNTTQHDIQNVEWGGYVGSTAQVSLVLTFLKMLLLNCWLKEGSDRNSVLVVIVKCNCFLSFVSALTVDYFSVNRRLLHRTENFFKKVLLVYPQYSLREWRLLLRLQMASSLSTVTVYIVLTLEVLLSTIGMKIWVCWHDNSNDVTNTISCCKM